MSQTASATLDPASPEAWASLPYETLLSLPKDEVEEAQREVLSRRFETLRPRVAALDNLASRQGVDRIETFADAPPVFFDHRVYKSYPLSLIEQRKFGRMTAWLQRLTAHDLSSIPMDGVSSVDAWLDRLDEHGMLLCHTTGTSGKLSFIPRSQVEWATWSLTLYEKMGFQFGYDARTEPVPWFTPGYRRGHYHGGVLERLLEESLAGGAALHHVMYDFALSSDLLSLAARLQEAEERGELDALDIDPKVLEDRSKLIERGRSREADLQTWFFKLAEDYRGQRVRIQGQTAEMIRLARKGNELGIVCEFGPGSLIATGGGMKGLKDPPADWQQFLKDSFGVDRIYADYGMSECMGLMPECAKGCFHFLPYVLPIVLDDDFAALPREGVQTGRMALFDILAETYWGGFISGDRVTIHWDYACECGWTGPRIEKSIVRFSELEGVEDDKLTCAGTAEAYSEFMDYVAEV
jgi:hypothetical protein